LGEDYAGWLTHDGWAVYYKFLKAAHQRCNAHLIVRCRKMAEAASATASRFPLQVKSLLEEALQLRDGYQENKISLHGLWTATGRPDWLARWFAPTAMRLTADWPSTFGMSGLTCSHSSIVRAWTLPITWSNA
jgi:Transposase IS66 family